MASETRRGMVSVEVETLNALARVFAETIEASGSGYLSLGERYALAVAFGPLVEAANEAYEFSQHYGECHICRATGHPLAHDSWCWVQRLQMALEPFQAGRRADSGRCLEKPTCPTDLGQPSDFWCRLAPLGRRGAWIGTPSVGACAVLALASC